MNLPSAKMLVLVGEKFACVKIVGRANFTSSIDFKTLINELLQKGYKFFVLELSECVLMDSTFLGVLAGFGLKIAQEQKTRVCSAVELLNPNPRITDLLENLGVLHLFKIAQGSLPALLDVQATAAEPAKPTKEEVTRTCLEAHRTLMEIHPDNIPRFKDVTQFLAEDLKQLKAST